MHTTGQQRFFLKSLSENRLNIFARATPQHDVSVKGADVNSDAEVEGLHRSRGSIIPSGSIPDDPLGDTQGGRPRLAAKETPREDSRVSTLNPQDPPNHLSHIPNGFESNAFCPCVL